MSHGTVDHIAGGLETTRRSTVASAREILIHTVLQQKAERYLRRHGHADLLTMLGLVEPLEVKPPPAAGSVLCANPACRQPFPPGRGKRYCTPACCRSADSQRDRRSRARAAS